jgi:hypothetical protein
MTSHTTEGWLSLSGVTITGTEGAPGSTLSWTGFFTAQNTNFDITDSDSDGRLDQGSDYWYSADYFFSGYTYTSGGVEYPIFKHLTNGYRLIIGEDATDNSFPVNVIQTTVPTSGTSNPFQAETGTNVYLCFAAGTWIAVPSGDTAVECLKIGDLVCCADDSIVPIKWIGRQTVSTRFGPAERLMPVRFAAGSLGDGLPQTDLTVTADHGMLVEGVICHAGALVNGTTITRVPLSEMGETYTVYHIETEEHEIILANGAPAETFIDNVSRRAFDNFAEFEALYGDVPEMEELPYPRAMSARQVPVAIKVRLDGKAVA